MRLPRLGRWASRPRAHRAHRAHRAQRLSRLRPAFSTFRFAGKLVDLNGGHSFDGLLPGIKVGKNGLVFPFTYHLGVPWIMANFLGKELFWEFGTTSCSFGTCSGVWLRTICALSESTHCFQLVVLPTPPNYCCLDMGGWLEKGEWIFIVGSWSWITCGENMLELRCVEHM